MKIEEVQEEKGNSIYSDCYTILVKGEIINQPQEDLLYKRIRFESSENTLGVQLVIDGVIVSDEEELKNQF